jgi:hypothetical protein
VVAKHRRAHLIYEQREEMGRAVKVVGDSILVVLPGVTSFSIPRTANNMVR